MKIGLIYIHIHYIYEYTVYVCICVYMCAYISILQVGFYFVWTELDLVKEVTLDSAGGGGQRNEEQINM